MKPKADWGRTILNNLYGDDWSEYYTQEEMLLPAVRIVEAIRTEAFGAAIEAISIVFDRTYPEPPLTEMVKAIEKLKEKG